MGKVLVGDGIELLGGGCGWSWGTRTLLLLKKAFAAGYIGEWTQRERSG